MLRLPVTTCRVTVPPPLLGAARLPGVPQASSCAASAAHAIPAVDATVCVASEEDGESSTGRGLDRAAAEPMTSELGPAFRVIRRPGVLNLGADLGGHGFGRLEGVSLGGSGVLAH